MGATRNEIIDTLISYGAVTAGMLDGGSSSMLYRDYFTKYNIDQSQLDEYQRMDYQQAQGVHQPALHPDVLFKSSRKERIQIQMAKRTLPLFYKIFSPCSCSQSVLSA